MGVTKEQLAAKKSKGKAAPAEYRYEFVQFALSEAERSSIRALALEDVVQDEVLDDLVQEGYRVTLKWDERASCHACYVNGPAEPHGNAHLILGARGSTPLKALKQALWLHFRKFEEAWPRNAGYVGQSIDD